MTYNFWQKQAPSVRNLCNSWQINSICLEKGGCSFRCQPNLLNFWSFFRPQGVPLSPHLIINTYYYACKFLSWNQTLKCSYLFYSTFFLPMNAGRTKINWRNCCWMSSWKTFRWNSTFIHKDFGIQWAKSYYLLRNALFIECFDLIGAIFFCCIVKNVSQWQKAQKLSIFFFTLSPYNLFLPGLINCADTFSNWPPSLLHYRFTKRLFGQGDRRQQEMMMTGTKWTEAGRTSTQVLLLPVSLCGEHCVCVCVIWQWCREGRESAGSWKPALHLISAIPLDLLAASSKTHRGTHASAGWAIVGHYQRVVDKSATRGAVMSRWRRLQQWVGLD